MNSWEQGRYKEIWIDTEDVEQAMMALINGDFGWLLYLREEGDAGFHSKNPAYIESDDKTMEFYLSNGQLDQYPLAWVLPIEQIKKALDYFETYHQLPDFITWYCDSK